MYTIVAQKVTQCFRKYKKPDKRSENPIQHTVCLFIPGIPPNSLMKMEKNTDFPWLPGRKIYSNSLLLYKGTKQVYGIPKQRIEVSKLANTPEIVSFMYQNAHKMSAVSKWAMLCPDLVRYLECF